MKSYLRQLASKLKPGGMGFLHHSNLGMYMDPQTGQLTLENTHSRGVSMSAALFREYCQEFGLTCVSQELIAWGSLNAMNDCFSVFTLSDGSPAPETKILENPSFFDEAAISRKAYALSGRERTTLPFLFQQLAPAPAAAAPAPVPSAPEPLLAPRPFLTRANRRFPASPTPFSKRTNNGSPSSVSSGS
jgi:hypothetical protein